jgi:hypothetical protein
MAEMYGVFHLEEGPASVEAAAVEAAAVAEDATGSRTYHVSRSD